MTLVNSCGIFLISNAELSLVHNGHNTLIRCRDPIFSPKVHSLVNEKMENW